MKRRPTASCGSKTSRISATIPVRGGATLGGKLVAGKRLYHPVKCVADAKLGALARGMAQGHNSMETMSTPRQDMLVGALEGFLEDLPSS